MTIDQILKLLDAGYTKADIDNLESSGSVGSTPDEDTSGSPVESAEPAPAEVTASPQPEAPAESAILAEMKNILSAIQKANLGNAEQPDTPAVTGASVTAELIKNM